MTRTPKLYLVVTRGLDLGARLLADDTPRIVGRARGADLLLTDVSVSRRHLRITRVDGGVDVQLMPGAAPFLVGGAQVERALAKAGEQVVIGDTVLSVAEVQVGEGEGDAPAARAEVEVTRVPALLDGLATDVRGLAAVFALSEALDTATDRALVEVVLASWAARFLEATGAALLSGEDGGPDEATPTRASGLPVNEVVERSLPGGGYELVVPAGAGELAALRVSVPGRPSDPLRRLLVVAGRVIGSSLARLRTLRSVEDDQRALRRQAVGSAQAFLGSSPSAEQVGKMIPRLAASDACVLLLGESGTGKTFVARLIHELGPRAREPLRVINCAAIPENLVESELFGHERGAFTGALATRAGAFEAAGRGTVLLDEIGELPLASQAKLLRVLEDKRYERIGSNRPLTLTARVLAATNRDLSAMVAAGRFRGDLFFRVSVINLRVPALRERGADVVLLARQVLADLAPSAGRRVRDFTPAALEAIRSYGWPGNVRELRNAIEHAIVLGDGPMIEPSDLPESVRLGPGAPQPADASLVRLPANIEWLEGRAIEAAMRATGGNRTRAAAILGINRVTLYKKLKEDPAEP